MTKEAALQPLEGLRIIDLTRLLPGPLCTMLMGDYGAEVIKVEDVDAGDPTRFVGTIAEDGSGSFFRALNRNKKSIAVDLKKDQGREILLKLAATADVLVEGFRPGVMQRLGLDYEQVKKINPSIVYASITGYGQEGSLRERAGHDINYCALTGLLDLSAAEGEAPVMPAVQIADIAGGSLMALNGIMFALYRKTKSGIGSYIDVSMTRGLLPWLIYASSAPSASGGIPRRNSGHITGAYACYNIYQTADHKYMCLGALEPVFWQRFCKAVNKPDWVDRQFDQNKRLELIDEVQKLFNARSRQEWIILFEKADACCEPVLTPEEAAAHLLNRENEFWLNNYDENGVNRPVPGYPLIFSGFAGALRLPPPGLGEHTREILKTAGFKETAIEELYKSGIIRFQ